MKCKGFVCVRVTDHCKLGWLRFFSLTQNSEEYQGAALSFSSPLFSFLFSLILSSQIFIFCSFHFFSSLALCFAFSLFSPSVFLLLTSVYLWCYYFMFTVCVYLPLISVTSASLPPSCLPSHVCSHFSPPSLHLLPPFPLWSYGWCDPSHCTSWIIEVKPSTCLLPNKSQALSPLFPSPLTFSPLFIDAFLSLMSTSGYRSNRRFLRVTWDLVFPLSFWANPEEFWQL